MEKETLKSCFNILETKYDEAQVSYLDLELTNDTISLIPKTEKHKLDEEIISWDDVYSKLLDKLRYLNNIKKSEFKDKLNITEPLDLKSEISARKLITKIVLAGNIIAQEGRIGPANFVIMNSELKEFVINQGFDILKMNIFVDDNLKNEIFIGRKSDVDQPSVIVTENGVSYKIISIGSHPEYQYAILNYQ